MNKDRRGADVESDPLTEEDVTSFPTAAAGAKAAMYEKISLLERLSATSPSKLLTRRALAGMLACMFLFAIMAMMSGSGSKGGEGGEESLEDGEGELRDDEEHQLFVSEEDLASVYSKDKVLIGPAKECEESAVAKVPKGTFEYDMLAADCGLGYDYTNSTSKRKPWKVALYGPSWSHTILGLSGCLVGKGKCPHSPKCTFVQTTDRNEARSADVVVLFQNDAGALPTLNPKRPGQYRVLYWREAYMHSVSIEMQRKFDFEMGVHWWSGILNPQFAKTPASLLGGITYPFKQVIPFIPVEQRENFAMSIISVCGAPSKRRIYIDRLVHYLGSKRVHQYGKCGNLELPPPPIKNAAKIIASYKFYLSFENTIEDGYCTEKLLQVLAMPVVPVYYGTQNTPNITLVPSFIKASDFSHPKYLADYLLHLDQHPEEYNRYHAWRTNPKLFHPDYLKMLAMKSPGPGELLPLREAHRSDMYPRTAACCRLCDENYLEWATESRDHFIEPRWNSDRIEKKFFEGHFFANPKE